MEQDSMTATQHSATLHNNREPAGTTSPASVARIRGELSAQAMLVPWIAFLDDLTRWNLVIFLDKLPANPPDWIHRVEPLGPLRWR